MSQESQVLENRIVALQRQITLLTSEREEYKALYISISESRGRSIEQAERLQELLEKYQAWFAYHRNWIEHHNRIIRWNPNSGYPEIRGGHPNTPLSPQLSTVARTEEEA